ncbi:hypothetical protein [Thiobacillus sp.]|uniref:hypothetical protein n=1 Tax=Thiobacillus sp. TaxID=924 RepID=UPI0017B0FAE9|nr:hypothetical protein [Thiobacillus sp.]MBC2731388.1 hypothetical protein [Thiobacillus sp.]MBC2740125.1 hypothetical protein [Thiobacillus sp.]MBC2758337.1 hypothetical protein [Thiobacillus sp.]
MPLPSPISKTNCDASTDDPKLALLVDLAAAIDTINALIASVQPLDDELTTLSGISPTQAADLAALSAFMGTVLNDASAAVALSTLGAPLNAVAAKSAAYTVVAADRGKLIDYTSGSYTLGIGAAATLGAGFVFAYRNSGSGTITIDPNGSEQIDGATTLSVGPGESGFAVCTGTAWRTVGRTVALPAATASIDGYMTSTYAAKLDGIAAGATVGISKDVGVGGIGMMAMMRCLGNTVASGATTPGGNLNYYAVSGSYGSPPGTWRNITGITIAAGDTSTFQRIA